VKRKRFSMEQIVAVLKQAEIGVPVAELIRQVGIAEQTLYRWKKQYKGLDTDQVRQFKQLQEENGRLKRLVAELTLDKTMLQDVLSKSCEALAAPPGGELHARHAAEDSRDRASQGSLWLPQDPSAAESRGLESGKEAGVSAVPRRGPDATTQATAEASRFAASPRPFPVHRTQSSVEPGFRGRPIGGWTTVPSVDDHGCVYAGKSGSRERIKQCIEFWDGSGTLIA